MANKKRMSQKEKDSRAAAKKRLQEKGVLPPDKPRLNRKKFVTDTWNEWNAEMTDFADLLYLRDAIGCMIGPKMQNVSLEQVGVAKVVKIAVELKRYGQRKGDGETVESLVDDVLLPILKL